MTDHSTILVYYTVTKEAEERVKLTREPRPEERDKWTEDPEALMDTNKCFMVTKSKGCKTVMKNILQELSSEQKETHKEKNDCIAFLQSGRKDNARVVRELNRARHSDKLTSSVKSVMRKTTRTTNQVMHL